MLTPQAQSALAAYRGNGLFDILAERRGVRDDRRQFQQAQELNQEQDLYCWNWRRSSRTPRRSARMSKGPLPLLRGEGALRLRGQHDATSVVACRRRAAVTTRGRRR